MNQRAIIISSFAAYLSSGADTAADQAAHQQERTERLRRFPYSVMLHLSYPELDHATLWCWQRFGPSDGHCTQHYSPYRACELSGPHQHQGNWMSHWFVKTDYDFGFNEWYFAEKDDRERFLAYVQHS